ncbi:RidA family protein [Horticoccus luteus]|uniref:RidA family protein n=1 Tax=Horticoccus luteus TaxID=2862869 RepID=A0A8F9TX17_9BACT|nr:RidA family protein [Horticoccus luteus]
MWAAAVHAAETTPEQRLSAQGVTLSTAPAAIANYVPAVRTGSLVFLAGQIPRDPAGGLITGKVGRDATEAQAAAAARVCAVQLLSALKTEIGELARVKRVVRVGGFVNCTDDFTGQSKVVNGASDLLVAAFGERGRHARASVGVAALPGNALVEVEMLVEVAD